MKEKERHQQYYKLSLTQNDFGWPISLPVCEKPSQPPIRTGNRVYCPEREESITLQDEQVDFESPVTSLSKVNKPSNSNLMKRKEILKYPPRMTYKHYMPERERWKSTFQVDFVYNKITFDRLINEIRRTKKPEIIADRCKKLKMMYFDPVPFKKFIDKGPILI